MASKYHIVAGSAWGASLGLIVVLLLIATGLIRVHVWEWLLAAVAGSLLAGAMGGALVGIRERWGR